MRLNNLATILLSFLFFLPIEKMKAQPSAESTHEYPITYEGKRIYGLLERPTSQDTRKKPLAIISHGFNGSHLFGEGYAKELTRAGWLCYRYDFCGGSVYTRSSGTTMDMTLTSESNDLKAVIEHFKNHPEVDANRITLIGESQGGMVSAWVAAEQPEDIHRLVLVFPAFCIPDDWLPKYPTTESVPDTVRIWNIPLSKNYIEDLRGRDVFKTIAHYQDSVLIIHGSADGVVPVSYAERAAKAYKKAELHILPGAGHGFKPEEQQQSMAFIRKYLSIE